MGFQGRSLCFQMSLGRSQTTSVFSEGVGSEEIVDQRTGSGMVGPWLESDEDLTRQSCCCGSLVRVCGIVDCSAAPGGLLLPEFGDWVRLLHVPEHVANGDPVRRTRPDGRRRTLPRLVRLGRNSDPGFLEESCSSIFRIGVGLDDPCRIE